MSEKEKAKAIIDAATDYEMPAHMRFMTRIINGVPTNKAGALFRQEITLARAKASHAGSDQDHTPAA